MTTAARPRVLTRKQWAVLNYARHLPPAGPPVPYRVAAADLGIAGPTVRSAAVRLARLGHAEVARLGGAPVGYPAGEGRPRSEFDTDADPPKKVADELLARRDRVRDGAERRPHRRRVVELPIRVCRVTPEAVSRRGRAAP